MDIVNAVTALSALAQETRLKVFRFLVEKGPEGAPSTEIAASLGVRQNLMSTHLSVLSQSGLTKTRRDGRRIYHAVDFDAMRALLTFLVRDCCHGQPEKCATLLNEILPLGACAENAAV
ncbi:MAG: metalloregulator ArsR/SmtB family transcription factor [Pseudomonadota bacterium]